MSSHRLSTTTMALLLAAVPVLGHAQQVKAPRAVSAASSSPAAKPGSRTLSAEETLESSTVPGDLRPERPVVPQISIPLGKGAAPPLALRPADARRRSAAASAGGIDDSAARRSAQE